MTLPDVDYLFCGGLREDYCITHEGNVRLGVLGGNAAYAAGGALIWSDSVGIVSRVGTNFPRQWLEKLSKAGINVDGVHILPGELDTRTFYAYLSEEARVDTNPAAHFLRINHPLPKELIGYSSSTHGQDERNSFSDLSIRPEDLPPYLSQVKAAHLAPAHYLSHTVIPVRLRQAGIKLITLDPSVRYMQPSFREEVPILIHGLDVFLPSESEAHNFFRPDSPDVWQMAEAFGEMGCRYIVIKAGASGQYLWDHEAKKRWHIPPYPVSVRDVTGAGDAYCGGFLVGYDKYEDIVEAALRGSISASLTIEGYGPLYPREAHPGLAEARLEAHRSSVRLVQP